MLEKDLELFEDYLLDSLSTNEKSKFEQRLNSEPEFKTDFEAYENTTRSLEHKFGTEEERNAFKQNLTQQSDAYFKLEKAGKKSFSLYKYAAVAVLLISALGFFMINSSSPTYAEYVTIDSISLTQRGTSNDLVKKGEDAFNTKSFKEASTYLDELIAQEPTNQEFQLYYGIASIENNDFANALKSLNKVAKGNSVYKFEAQWNIALAYLKQKDYGNTKSALEKIPKSAPEFSKANKLLKKL